MLWSTVRLRDALRNLVRNMSAKTPLRSRTLGFAIGVSHLTRVRAARKHVTEGAAEGPYREGM